MSYRSDLRVERSKRMIKNAFLDLLEERDFDEISIKEIAARAMVSRKTFYVYYSTKMELYEEIMAEALKVLDLPKETRSGCTPEQSLRQKLVLVLQQLNRDRRVYRVLMQEQGNSLFRSKLNRFIRDEVMPELNGSRIVNLPEGYPPKLFEAQVFAHIYSFLGWWVGQYDVQEEEMADIMLETIRSSGLLQLPPENNNKLLINH